MSVPNSAVVNAGLKYVNGLQLSAAGGNKLVSVAAGEARDSSNTNDIKLESAVVINGANVGANGVDVAAVVASSMYAVYVIASSTSVFTSSVDLGAGMITPPGILNPTPAPANPHPVACMLSLRYPNGPVVIDSVRQEIPVLPAGYDMYRRIGWVSTDGSSNVLRFWQYGSDETRWYYLDRAVLVATAATGAGLSAVPLAVGVAGDAAFPAVPAMAAQVLLDVTMSAAGTARFAPFGSASAAGVVRFSGDAALPGSVIVPEQLNVVVPTVQVGVSAGTAAIAVVGYQDCL